MSPDKPVKVLLWIELSLLPDFAEREAGWKPTPGPDDTSTPSC